MWDDERTLWHRGAALWGGGAVVGALVAWGLARSGAGPFDYGPWPGHALRLGAAETALGYLVLFFLCAWFWSRTDPEDRAVARSEELLGTDALPAVVAPRGGARRPPSGPAQSLEVAERWGPWFRWERTVSWAELPGWLGPRRALGLIAGAAGTGAFGTAALGLPWAIPPVVAGLLGFVAWSWIVGRSEKRLRAFVEAFPEALGLMVRALMAGQSVNASLAVVAEELEGRTSKEFRKLFDDLGLGAPLPTALDGLCARVPLAEVEFFASALLLQSRSGGNLMDVLRSLAEVVRQRVRLRQLARAKSGEARVSIHAIAGMSAWTLGLHLANGPTREILLHDPLGRVVLSVAVIMLTFGLMAMTRMSKIEV